jgi:hypothetical protein
MAVCKKCGCAIPLGSKDCDMCKTTGAIAPAASTQSWQAPANALPVTELASSAASWATGQALPTGSSPLDIAGSLKVRQARSRLRWAWGAAAFVGGLGAGISLIAELGPVPELQTLFNWGSLVEGGIYCLLAYFIYRRSKIALGIATALYILDFIAILVTGHAVGVSFVRLAILFAFFRAFTAIDVLKQADRAAAPASASSQGQLPRAA